MNFAPSDHPRLAGAANLSKPGFDIILAVSGARQAALPTAALLEHDDRIDTSAARRAILCGTIADMGTFGPRPARFFDLSDEVNASAQSMNMLFTRGFQSMLNPSHIDESSPDIPPSGDEQMERT